MVDVVFDSSAILALLHREPGADIVLEQAGSAIVSAVNLGEIGARLVEHGMPEDEVRSVVGAVGVEIVPFDEGQAYLSAFLRRATRTKGLSLGDRACLALAKLRNLPALTADRVWAELEIDVEVRLIRGT
jgi:PIN domain nuclease of toxin-antitoxin system